MAEVVAISSALRAEREAILSRYLDALNSGDLDAAVSVYAEPRFEAVPSGRVLVGTDAVRGFLADRRRSFPDQAFELITLHHADDAVIAEYWMSGTHLGEVNNLEPSGRHMKVRMISVFQFAGPRLIGQRVYYDAGTVARQLA